jgi:hypothetical protein
MTEPQPPRPYEPIEWKITTRRRFLRRPQFRIGAVIAFAAAVAFGVWLALGHKSGGGTTTAQVTTGANAVSPSGLRTISDTLNEPVYWAGPQAGVTYELTQTPDGRIYVRYLPVGVEVGASDPYLTVSTYPVTDAYDATMSVAKRSSSVRLKVGSNAVAFWNRSRPTSVYEAFKGTNFQIEVFSPSAAQARRLVAGKLIRSAGTGSAAGAQTTAAPAGSPATQTTAAPVGATAATLGRIRSVADKIGKPVYWAGRKAGTRFELTETPDGRVYVRYLPRGVKIGSTTPYLTVATYPLAGAFAATTAAAAQKGAVKIAVDGGVAFYTPARPTSVYIAFQGTDEQIEVFDPSTKQLRKLVASGQIKPVS